MIVLILNFSNCPILWPSGIFSVSLQSVVIRWDHPGANWSLQSICLPLKLDCCGAESGCALLRLNRNTFGITLFQISSPRPCRRKRGSLSGESHVIPCPACGSLSLDCTSVSLSLSLSVLATTEQCRPSSLPSGRRPVGSGTNSAGCHCCFHTYCSSSYSSQVSTVS